MTNIVLSPSIKFPPGTSVAAYAAGNWQPWLRPPTGAPVGSVAETQTVASDGSLTYTTLTDGAEYFAYASVGGQDRYIRFFGTATSSPLIPDGTLTDLDFAAANKDGVAGKPSLRTLGTAAGQAALGTHASQHAPGAADALDYTVVNAVGLLVNIPAASASNTGLTYYATDTRQFLRSNGTIWVDVQRPGWQVADNKLLASTIDPAVCGTGQVNTLGFVTVFRMFVPETITVANIGVFVITAGGTLTSGQCLAGIYKSDNTLIAKTATQHTAWQTTGIKTAALTAEAGQSLTITGGPGVWIYGALVANGTTAPAFAATTATAIGTLTNYGLAAADGLRSAFQTAGAQTTLPSTLGALTVFSAANWLALT